MLVGISVVDQGMGQPDPKDRKIARLAQGRQLVLPSPDRKFSDMPLCRFHASKGAASAGTSETSDQHGEPWDIGKGQEKARTETREDLRRPKK